MTDDKWYLAGDGSAGRWDSGDADADRAGDIEYVSDDEDVHMAYDKHDAVLVAQAFQNLPKGGWVLDWEEIDNIDIKEQ